MNTFLLWKVLKVTVFEFAQKPVETLWPPSLCPVLFQRHGARQRPGFLLDDLSAGRYLPLTADYWFKNFVDPQYGEVWKGVNYGTNTPQRDYPKGLGLEECLSLIRTCVGGLHYCPISPRPAGEAALYFPSAGT